MKTNYRKLSQHYVNFSAMSDKIKMIINVTNMNNENYYISNHGYEYKNRYQLDN